jgi:hypothetical protein
VKQVNQAACEFRNRVLGLSLRGVEQQPGAALGLVAELLGVQPELVGLLGGLGEVALGRLLPDGQVAFGMITAPVEADLELGGRLPA